MSGEIVGIALVAVLFVLFGVLRPADRPESGGCHGCSHGDGNDCGVACPLLKDPEGSAKVRKCVSAKVAIQANSTPGRIGP